MKVVYTDAALRDLDDITNWLTAHYPGLAHDPEKWEPVFGKDHSQSKC